MGSEMMILGQNNNNKQQENNSNMNMKKKNNFTQTCNRFSQFLKERRSLGHLDAAFKGGFASSSSSDLDIKGVKDVCGRRNNNNATAINLLSRNMEKDKVSLELFPLTNSRAKTDVVDNSATKHMVDYSRELPVSMEEPKNNTTSPSMTIFYDGKVIVLNELPEDKAREIMSLATRGTLSSGSQAQTPRSINIGATHHNRTQGVLSQGASNLSSFPITRSISLHRFIEKRKHRIAANAPYQLPNSAVPKEAFDSHSQKSGMMGSLLEHQELELKL